MTKLKLMLMAILAIFTRLFALPTSAARHGGFNFLSAFCVVFFVGIMTACSVDKYTNDVFVTPLKQAVMSRNIAEVKRQIDEHRANVNEIDSNGFSLLHWAASLDDTEIAFVLVKAGADVHARTIDRKTPLDLAIKYHGIDSSIAIFLRGAMAKIPSKDRQKAEELLRELE